MRQITGKRMVHLLLVMAIAAGLAACGSRQSEDAGSAASGGASVPDAQVSSTAIAWLPFDEGLRQARATDRLMLVDFSASWCTWCKKMDAETFTQPDVIRYVNANFIPVRVMGDSDDVLEIDGRSFTERDLTRQAGIRGFPTFAVFDKDLARLYQFSGYRDAARFLTELGKVPAGGAE